MHSENFQHAWKNLIDSITQHPSTKPYKPLTIREQQLETQVQFLHQAIAALWHQLVNISVSMGELVVNLDRPDDGDEEIF